MSISKYLLLEFDFSLFGYSTVRAKIYRTVKPRALVTKDYRASVTSVPIIKDACEARTDLHHLRFETHTTIEVFFNIL